ncbi:HEAT repeat domain-containing protein [Schlesneria sp.]|uniref:HEAT repeat domain-containing protein n=1 Tax=Schlesneria sp. TaxID=2762018 RepID=UPI002F18CF62
MTAYARAGRVLAILIHVFAMGFASGADDRISLDPALREKCLKVLRAGMAGEEFWPAIHAAEALTLAGHQQEVIAFLTPKLNSETDDQRRCGIARELVRAGDRSARNVMWGILAGDKPHGHIHAAESLFKVADIGDGQAMRRAYVQNENPILKLMAAAALTRVGDDSARQTVRELLQHPEAKYYAIAAWVLGQIGDSTDIPRLKKEMERVGDPVPRANLEHALAILGDESGQKALERNLKSDQDIVRTYAATFAGDARLVNLKQGLVDLLDDRVADVRIRAAQSLLVLAAPVILHYRVQAAPVIQELNSKFCWFHPRVAAMPGFGKGEQPAVVMTIQKHLSANDHYSGLYYLRTDDLGHTWTGPTEIPELAWQAGDNGETIAVCDVTPGWLTHHRKVLAIGVKLRYSRQGDQLLDKPRSHECAYAVFDPVTNRWSPWKMLALPQTEEKFFLVAPGCVQWLEQADGSLLVPIYYRDAKGTQYATTVLHCSFDGSEMRYVKHGDELALSEGRGFYEPSLTRYQDRLFLTIRNDTHAYVTASRDGLHFDPVKTWTFDDGQDLGSYNTQAHWLTHSNGLFLTYTRRGADNDHIFRHRAPIFVAQVDPDSLQVIRATERAILPERGVMLGNFGAAAITPNESWVTDSEFLVSDKPHPHGADGTTWLGRVFWSSPNRDVPTK